MDFSDEERERLTEFKTRMAGLIPYEYAKAELYLIRWLRARDLNVEAAEEMLKNHLNWRKINKIDTLLQESPDNFFTKNYQYWLNGIDLKGQPVLCSPVGDWDILRIVQEDRIKEFEDYVNRMYERILEAIRRADERKEPEHPPITQFTLILNWDRFSVRQTANLKAIQTLVNIAATYEAHYPEILQSVIRVVLSTIIAISQREQKRPLCFKNECCQHS